MPNKLLTEHHLEFLSLNGGCTGSSESILVKMPHFWKSHAAAHISLQMHVFKYHYVTTSHTTTSKTHTQLVIRFLRCSIRNHHYILVPLAQYGRSLHGRWMKQIFRKLTWAICTTQVKIFHTRYIPFKRDKCLSKIAQLIYFLHKDILFGQVVIPYKGQVNEL